jgi:16S rRNA (guanine966-N2)-methyltransferase
MRAAPSVMARADGGHAPRIVAGRFRGRAIEVPRGRVTRPVRVLVRRSTFDRLTTEIESSKWLDLFAGAGSFGLEALSRGAAHATFVDSGREPLACLRRTLERFGLGPSETTILPSRLPELLLLPPPAPAPFDFVALDPPFALSRNAGELWRLVEALAVAGRRGWFGTGARLLWEEPSRAPAPLPAGFEPVATHEHGTSRVRWLRWQG